MHSGGLSRKALSGRLSSQETCRRSVGCPQLRARDHCRRGWSVQCGQTGVCCTAVDRDQGDRNEHKLWNITRTSHFPKTCFTAGSLAKLTVCLHYLKALSLLKGISNFHLSFSCPFPHAKTYAETFLNLRCLDLSGPPWRLSTPAFVA